MSRTNPLPNLIINLLEPTKQTGELAAKEEDYSKDFLEEAPGISR